jgi:phage-related minor tail protein
MSEVFAVLARHAAELQRKAADAKENAKCKRDQAERILLESCDVPPCPVLTSLSLRRDGLEKQLAEHRTTLKVADEHLPRQREVVASIERGEISPPACRTHGFPKLRVVVDDYYQQERKKLAQLVERAAGREAAVAAIEAAETELAELNEKTLEASEQQKQRMLDPRAMRWTLDD